MITTTECSNCSDKLYHLELDDETAVTYDGECFTLHLLHDEMQELYMELKEQLLHNS